ncbi:MAG TPA: hypothetical protein P5183_11735, partial [Smithellaceae bacterium]|nr:hypothetical protein [Smithellaceae bacterium]
MKDKISETLSGILRIFKSGQIPEAVSYAAFPSFNVPSDGWSLLNRVIMWLNGTHHEYLLAFSCKRRHFCPS